MNIPRDYRKSHVRLLVPSYSDGFLLSESKPSSSNAGVRTGITRRTIVGDQIITVNNTVLKDLRIEGRVIVRAFGAKLINCEIVGTDQVFTNASSPVGLVECFGIGRSVLLDRCTLKPQSPGPCVDGVRGWNITALRCDISQVTDGFGIIPTGANQKSGVSIAGCRVHSLGFWTQAGWRSHTGNSSLVVHPSDTATHNDCVQIHGGSGTELEGNFFSANSSFPDGVGQSPNGANRVNVGIQLDVGGNLGPINNTVIQSNWFDYGYAGQIQAAPKEAIVGTVISGNRFTTNNTSKIEIRMNGLLWSGTGNTLDGTVTPRSN